jgi:alkanesulfonate monooxygenase SsuD/methylene tetrahydromethanopterin reductase-like flavin-dependent oxidoreductase (luciferase family)
VSHRPVVEGWHGQTIDKPGSEMREYVAILRAILAGEEPPAGAKWQTGFQLGMPVAADLPIYVAALSPKMLETAGEIADGVILWLCNPQYIRDVVVPQVTKGREKAGKTLEGFDIVAAVPSALTDDEAGAYATMRKDLLPYFGLPVLPRDARALGLRGRHRRLRRGRRTRRRRRDAAGDLRGLPAGPHGGRHRGQRPRGRRALPGGRRDVAVRRPDPEDRLRVHAARRRRDARLTSAYDQSTAS